MYFFLSVAKFYMRFYSLLFTCCIDSDCVLVFRIWFLYELSGPLKIFVSNRQRHLYTISGDLYKSYL